MLRLKDITLKAKLITMFLLLSFVPLVIVGYLTYNNAKSALEEGAFAKLEAVTHLKYRIIEDYFVGLEGKLRLIKDNPFIQEKLQEFARDIGLDMKKFKYPVLLEDGNGKKYKASAENIKFRLGSRR